MFEMTPEQQVQIIAIFILGLGAIFTWFRHRLKINAAKGEQRLKEQADLHEQRILDSEAARQKDQQKINLRLAEIEQSAKTEDRLFSILDRLADNNQLLSKNSSEAKDMLEVFGGQLKHIRQGQDDVKDSFSGLSDTIAAFIKETKQTLLKYQDDIAMALEVNKENAEEYSTRLHNMFSEISAIHRLLNQMQETNDTTQPIPTLPEAATPEAKPSDTSTHANENDNKKDIV